MRLSNCRFEVTAVQLLLDRGAEDRIHACTVRPPVVRHCRAGGVVRLWKKLFYVVNWCQEPNLFRSGDIKIRED